MTHCITCTHMLGIPRKIASAPISEFVLLRHHDPRFGPKSFGCTLGESCDIPRVVNLNSQALANSWFTRSFGPRGRKPSGTSGHESFGMGARATQSVMEDRPCDPFNTPFQIDMSRSWVPNMAPTQTALPIRRARSSSSSLEVR